MHTDQTLDIFDETTVQIGAQFRAFNNKTCPAFDTRELPRETRSRQCRQAKKAAANQRSITAAGATVSTTEDAATSQTPLSHPSTSAIASTTRRGPRQKKFNLHTYKHHSLGDYPKTIRQYGTTDSYSTEPVSHGCWWRNRYH